MKLENKIKGARHSLNNTEYTQCNKAFFALQEIRELCLYYATRYRYDPTVSELHNEYLEILNMKLMECEI